jgi:hypothetical protein
MESEIRRVSLSFVYQLFKAITKGNLNYIYRGVFNQRITENILSLAETNIFSKEESSTVKKRVYHIMVECLQNITRHQSVRREDRDENTGVFFIQRKDLRYFVTTGNLVQLELVEDLKSKLEMVNKLEPEDLKKYYKTVLINGHLSEKGGAGLGLIDMARKSGNKLLYDFKQIDDHFSYFYLNAEIPSGELFDEEILKKRAYSLSHISELHNMLNRHNILILFNSYFSQESMINLLSIMENHLAELKSVRKKIYQLMVEMIQNIVHHAINPGQQESGNPGMFFINESEDRYSLNTGNYILNEIAETLHLKIEKINRMTEDELDDFYNETIMNFEIESKTKAGLGLMDMRIKSRNLLEYNVKRVNDKISFFTLRANIEKTDFFKN